MKKIAWLLLFSVVWICGDRMISNLLSQLVFLSQTKFSLLYKGGQHHRIVLMGNSRGDASLSPLDIEKKTGISTFQLSHKGLSTELIRVLWLDYIERNDPPEMLVMELTNLTTGHYLLNDLKTFGYWSPRINSLLEKYNYSGYIATRISKLFHFNSEILLRSLGFLGHSDQGKIENNIRQIDETLARDLLRRDIERRDIRPENLKALSVIVRTARKFHCRVCLYYPPYYLNYFRDHEKQRDELLAQVRGVVGEYAAVRDYSAAITDKNAFEDLSHLNYGGAKIFLEILLKDHILSPGPKFAYGSIAAHYH
ncbi:hypothetical protein DENIS_1880 [Desulfonema ishimotonii]|uniref:SGNH/GDSL hydrolase family protein n=1 Tax=Desulfonema ishimotonii TaxID=45657 RepID=A0A401FVC9_9BACT|nr:hypothetical protein [Desulfonema ishimotonii]GBC60920.1 hypothetical protein DENIS_1880 [Desulfonema ishimotonii]